MLDFSVSGRPQCRTDPAIGDTRFGRLVPLLALLLCPMLTALGFAAPGSCKVPVAEDDENKAEKQSNGGQGEEDVERH
jgi:hypothetical protein